MTWDEAVAQHERMLLSKEIGVPRDCISVCTYDDYEIAKLNKSHEKHVENRQFC